MHGRAEWMAVWCFLGRAPGDFVAVVVAAVVIMEPSEHASSSFQVPPAFKTWTRDEKEKAEDGDSLFPAGVVLNLSQHLSPPS
jgi:hypothetical protein